jgi:hypothetical protein
MALAWGSGILDTVEGHLYFQRDFLLIHCKKNSEVSRHRINSRGLILCEWFPAVINLSTTETCCSVSACKKLYQPGLSFRQRCTINYLYLNKNQ